MAVSDNQNKYLTNMAAGKTSTGGQATAGNQAWAKAQLAKVPAPPAAPKPTMTPVTGSVPAPTSSQGSPPQGAPPMANTPASVPTPPKTTNTFSSPQYNDWMTKQNEAFANLEKLMSTPFEYNPETDPAYLAQRQLAQNRAQSASNSTLEAMNERGIMGSSLTANQLGQIQQNAEQEALSYIPQYRQQAYGQYQDRLSNAGNLLSQARALRGDQFNETVTEAGLTGNYMSPEARGLATQLNNLKQVTEQNWSTMSAEDRAAARAQGDQIRAQLQGLGVDSTLFGHDVTANNAMGNMNRAGLRTMDGQQMDYNMATDQRNFDYNAQRDVRGDFESDRAYNFQTAQQEWQNNFNQAQFDESKAERIWEQAFKEKSFAQSVKDAAASRGLQWASLNQRDKEFIADQAWKEKQFAYQQQQDNAANSNISPYVEEFSKLYVNRDPSTGTTAVSNPQALRNAIIGRNLSDEMTDQLMLYYGLPIN